LIPIHSGRPLCIGSMPRLRMITTAAAIRPNTAPDAPTVNAFGSNSSAPNEPHRSDTK
jgi:hypothetical protein